MSSDEKNYAYKWAKAQNARSTFISAKSAPIKEEEVAEEMIFWKKKLLNAPFENREKIIDKLIDLRAKQTMAFIENTHVNSEPLAEKKINQAIEHYYIDCIRLIAAAKRL